MKNKIVTLITDLLVAIIGITGLYLYLKNEGIYILSNLNNTELEWINKYSVYDVPFPDDVFIENFCKKSDALAIPFVLRDEYIQATLLVPNSSIEKIIPNSIRDYDLDYGKDKDGEPIQYEVWMPRTVIKWGVKTQRTISYKVMQPDEQYTRVYVLVDKLGWNLFEVQNDKSHRR